MDIWDFIAFSGLRISTDRFLDWAAVLMYGHKPTDSIGTIFALFVQIMVAGGMGAVFAYLLPLVGTRNILLKGALWGFALGFLFYAIPIAFKMPVLSSSATLTVVSRMVGATIWGAVTGLTLGWLVRREPRGEVS